MKMWKVMHNTVKIFKNNRKMTNRSFFKITVHLMNNGLIFAAVYSQNIAKEILKYICTKLYIKGHFAYE